jgi:hypothetical protein
MSNGNNGIVLRLSNLICVMLLIVRYIIVGSIDFMVRFVSLKTTEVMMYESARKRTKTPTTFF